MFSLNLVETLRLKTNIFLNVPVNGLFLVSHYLVKKIN